MSRSSWWARREEGRTLYFDLMWYDQTTRAGQTDYVLVAEVPKDWVGGIATLTCAARRNGTLAGRMEKRIGLYLSGNSDARQRVEKLLAVRESAGERDVLDASSADLGADALLSLLDLPEARGQRKGFEGRYNRHQKFAIIIGDGFIMYTKKELL